MMPDDKLMRKAEEQVPTAPYVALAAESVEAPRPALLASPAIQDGTSVLKAGVR